MLSGTSYAPLNNLSLEQILSEPMEEIPNLANEIIVEPEIATTKEKDETNTFNLIDALMEDGNDFDYGTYMEMINYVDHVQGNL